MSGKSKEIKTATSLAAPKSSQLEAASRTARKQRQLQHLQDPVQQLGTRTPARQDGEYPTTALTTGRYVQSNIKEDAKWKRYQEVARDNNRPLGDVVLPFNEYNNYVETKEEQRQRLKLLQLGSLVSINNQRRKKERAEKKLQQQLYK